MAKIEIKKATKSLARGRVALMGPSGHGKTWTSLLLARQLAGPGGRVCVIDSERGSASKYAKDFDFDTIILDSFSPATYVEAIHAAEDAGHPVIVIDSLTHAWSGKDGALEQVDKAAARSKSGNSYTAWRDVTPMHNALVDAMLQSPAHIIVTMRVKSEYVIEKNEHGKSVPRKVGLQPIQRDGLEYEFDIVADMAEKKIVVTKSRCKALDDAVQMRPDEKFFQPFIDWLNDGEPSAPPAPKPPILPPVTLRQQLANEVAAWAKTKTKEDTQSALRVVRHAAGVGGDKPATDEEAGKMLEWLRRNIQGGVGYEAVCGGA